MNCLVLGGNGFIGSHLVDKLISEGHHVRVFDKYEEHYRSPICSVDYLYGDFGNRGLLTEALHNIEIVFHLISTTLPKTSNDDPAFDIQSNLIDTIYLLEQCIAQKIKHIVFISSGGTIYGLPNTLPIKEDCPTNPLCSYGITKLAIEKYLELFSYLYGLSYTIIRPSNPYGSRQNPAGIQGAISVFLGKAVRNEVIEIWGDGEIVRDFIFIDDLIDGIHRAAITRTKSHIFNIGSGTGISINDILTAIRNVTHSEIKIEYKEKRSFDLPRIFLDITLAKEELGWNPVVPLESGIKKTLDFIKQIYK
ncbi:MAG: NAD-dependent epimerase/dehydratase family protein [Nitrospiraceae bacterium]|nr:NAD-dependent epimerase/dehydratase family protein [Nitrospiraceae bacterium]